MRPGLCAAFLLPLAWPGILHAQPQPASGASSPSFERRLGELVDKGGTTDAVQGKLNRLSSEASSAEQRLAIEAFQLVVRGLERDKGLSLADADAFAARHPQSGAALIAVGRAALNEHRLERSAEAYVAAVARTPALVDALRTDDIDELVGRLASRYDSRQLLNLGRSLHDAGWARGSASSRSYLAAVVMQDELRAGRVDQAVRLAPSVTDPQMLYGLMADRRFAAVRPEFERLWGPRLETRWRAYLAAYRDDWMLSGSRDAAVAYAHALQQANHHGVLVDQFLPRFMRGYNCWDDPVARRLVGYLVSSLNRLGRETKARDILGRMGSTGSFTTWAGPSLGSILLAKGDFNRAASIFELSIREAAKFPGNISPEALVLTEARLACANRQRGKPGRLPAMDMLTLSSRMWLTLCVEEETAAREVLLAALENEDQRLAAIMWMQPFADPPFAGPFTKEMTRRVRALQADDSLRAALSRHGEIHAWTLESSAPPEAGTSALRVRRASPCSDVRGDPMDAVKPPETLVEGRL